ncbi:MAG: hypothetical protein ACI9GB_002882, partial [Halioglobus sp.]
AARLEKVMDQREAGVVPSHNIADSFYQDLIDNPMLCIENIYQHFGMLLSSTARNKMLAYLQAKPKGKFGKHSYAVDASRKADRQFFVRYQEMYAVPNET